MGSQRLARCREGQSTSRHEPRQCNAGAAVQDGEHACQLGPLDKGENNCEKEKGKNSWRKAATNVDGEVGRHWALQLLVLGKKVLVLNQAHPLGRAAAPV